ncbi:MAG: hypothetical protein ACI4SF_14930 [Oscillospiraceae bacterium]
MNKECSESKNMMEVYDMFDILDDDIFDINGDGEVDFLEKALAYGILFDDEEEEDSDSYDDSDYDDD